MKLNLLKFILMLFLMSSYNLLIAQENMSLTFNTEPGNSTTITLPLYGIVNVTVDWGDGTPPQNITVEGNHNYTYGIGGEYTVVISGTLTQFGNGWAGYDNAQTLTRCNSFGNLGITSLSGAFSGAENLTLVPEALPSTVTDLSVMFYRATNFNQDINSWDVSNVTNMIGMFFGATSFNKDLSNWDVSRVNLMSGMFCGTTSFNRDLGSWNVSNVTNMEWMFMDAVSFNKNIGNWDVGNVAKMNYMFLRAISFNQDLSSWNVGNVTDMAGLFQNAISFNQKIGSWNVSKVTNMEWIFWSATLFNQDLSKWDVGNVINMDGMFGAALSFDQNIGSWNVSNVKTMKWMFWEAFLFNHNLDTWDVSNVTSMEGMFGGASSFNAYIGSWNVGNVANMDWMFWSALSFNHDLGKWDVSKVTSMANMFDNVKLANAKYNSLLLGWSQQTLQSNVKFDAGTSNYSNGTPSDARQSIIDNFGWSITDGGMINPIHEIIASANPSIGGNVNGYENFALHYEEGATATITATPKAGFTFVNWTENETEISADATISFSVNMARTLVANFSLKASADKPQKPAILVVYPNPARDFINIEIGYEQSFSSADFVLSDLRGQTYRTEKINIGQNKILLDVSLLAQGLYFIQVRINNNLTETIKVNIMK